MSAMPKVDEGTLVLGIETSCDETAAALVMGGYDVVSSAVSTQVDLHAQFGGVVPEVASRAHLDLLNPMIARAIVEAGVQESRIDAVACTVGPGLVGALLVGVGFVKALAFARGRPLVGVHHMEGHLFATSLEHPDAVPPFTALLGSGGHTLLLEVKDGRKPPSARQLTPAEQKFHARWPGDNLHIVNSVDEALELLKRCV